MYIYKITNLITNKLYIGQTTQDINKRWYQHKTDKNKYCVLLANALGKYGEINFTIETIATASSLEELNSLEEFYIKELNSLHPNGYNLLQGGNNKKHSEYTKEKMSLARRGILMTGKAAKGVPRKSPPPEVGRKISASKKGKSNGLLGKKRPYIPHPSSRKPITAINIETNEIIEFDSFKEACEKLNVGHSNILKVIRGERKHTKGFKFKYKLQEEYFEEILNSDDIRTLQELRNYLDKLVEDNDENYYYCTVDNLIYVIKDIRNKLYNIDSIDNNLEINNIDKDVLKLLNCDSGYKEVDIYKHFKDEYPFKEITYSLDKLLALGKIEELNDNNCYRTVT